MGLMEKLFGFRWSLYIVKNGKELVYVMHGDSVFRMVGYVMGSFSGGSKPVLPWSIHLNFNKKHKSFELLPEHFTTDGESITHLLRHQIESIDTNWEVAGAGSTPVFLEVATKKKIKISNDLSNLQEYMDNMKKPQDPTFYDILDIVFGNEDG